MDYKEVFNNYNIKATAMLPIHVGAGDENLIDPLEYVVKDGWFYRIDLDGMLRTDTDFARWFTTAAENAKAPHLLRRLFRDAFNPSVKEQWIHRSRVSSLFAEHYKNKFDDGNNQLLVQCLPLSGCRAYIPGSSIKGALRTAVLDCLATKDKNNKGQRNIKLYEKVRRAINTPDEKTQQPLSDKAHVAEAFILTGKTKMNPDQDPFRFIKISDALLPEDSTEIVQVININSSTGKGNIEMYVETVKPGTEFSFTISIASKKRLTPEDKCPAELLDIVEIWNMANEYLFGEPGNLGLEAEKHYYRKNRAASSAVDAIFDDAEKHSENGKITYLRVGRFSHLECMTYSDRPKDIYDKTPYLCMMSKDTHEKGWGKTRNLVEGKIPLGVMRLEMED